MGNHGNLVKLKFHLIKMVKFPQCTWMNMELHYWGENTGEGWLGPQGITMLKIALREN